MATDLFKRGEDVFLFHIDGQDLVRSKCAGGTTIRDRATCDIDRKHLPAATVYGSLQDQVQTSIHSEETAARETRIKIDRVDQRLLEILETSTPDPAEADRLRRRLAELEDEAVRLESAVVDLRDQVARLEAEFQRTRNPDDLALLSRVRQDLVLAVERRNGKQAEIDRTRDQLIALATDLQDPAMYQDLRTQRGTLVGQWDARYTAYEKVLTEASAVARAFKMIQDQGMTYEVMKADPAFETVKGSVTAIAIEFDDWSRDPYRFGNPTANVRCTPESPGGRQCSLDGEIFVRRGSTIAELHCRVSFHASCFQFEIMPPSRRGPWTYSEEDVTPESVGADDPLFAEPSRGIWKVKTSCIVAHREPSFRCDLVAKP